MTPEESYAMRPENPTISETNSPTDEAADAAAMHADHERWRGSLTQWQRDIGRWEAEHRAALSCLDRMREAIEEHGRSLLDHRRAFDAVAAAASEHEQCLAVGPDPDADMHAARHRLQHEAFLRHEDAHERIGRHHREVMARIRDLEECAGAAM